MTSTLKPFPFYYEELPNFKRVITSLEERDSIDVNNLKDWWFIVCKENNIFQLWNKEYIKALSEEILSLVGEDFILEVAAGDGMLSHWLREYGVNIKATDDMSWHNKKPNYGPPPIKLHSEVEELDAIEAIRKYRPRMVVASWIAYRSDIDCKILDEEPEYLLIIGEGQGGCTGSLKFWGNWTDLKLTEDGFVAVSNIKTAYWIQKGYIEKNLDVDMWNICRSDNGHEWGRHHSFTTLYTRGG